MALFFFSFSHMPRFYEHVLNSRAAVKWFETHPRSHAGASYVSLAPIFLYRKASARILAPPFRGAR